MLLSTNWLNVAIGQQPVPDQKLIYKEIESVNKGIAGKETADVKLQLHLFLPADHKATDKRTAVVFFFGGGWVNGSPQQFFSQSRHLANHGAVAISAEYRIKSKHGVTPFECVADAKSAIRWVREHAQELGVDPDKIVSAGGSAGGHIAACTGVIEGHDESTENASVSSVPNAMILFNPVLDTTKKGYGRNHFSLQRRTEISPCHHINSGIAPTLLFHGTADKTVPFENAERFTKLMEEAGNRCDLISFEGKGHGFFNKRKRKTQDSKAGENEPTAYDQTMEASVEFLTSIDFLDKNQAGGKSLDADSKTGSSESKKSKPNPDANQDSSAKTKKPNILVIYTDDQGYGDLSVLNANSKFTTPNIDRIAAEGIAFTNGHSSDSVCTPSRYGLLTGRYAWRTKLKRGVFGAEAACLIRDGRMTIASMLKENGYNTAMVGKWHLGMEFPGEKKNRDWSKPVLDMPLDKGFDYFFGIPASLNYGILAWFEGRHAVVPPTLYTNKKKNARHEDYRIMPPYDKTSEETKTALNRQGFEIADDFVDNQCLTRFTDKAIKWMEGKVADAKSGKPFFLYLPYTSPHFPVCPLPEFHGKGGCGAYGEFLIETDYHVGRVLDFLTRSGLDENTMVVFTSDNGPERPWKNHLDEFGHDSRGGFREGKRSVYEGGHRVPFLVRWPNGIVSPGRKWSQPIGQVDLLSTLGEIVGANVPEDAGEDSQSFASILRDPNASPKRLPLINHGNGGGTRFSITEGNWKLILPSKKIKQYELYDLSSDQAEANNLSDEYPGKVQSLKEKISKIVVDGRTTHGKRQKNDTGYWTELAWMSEKEYDDLSVSSPQ